MKKTKEELAKIVSFFNKKCVGEVDNKSLFISLLKLNHQMKAQQIALKNLRGNMMTAMSRGDVDRLAGRVDDTTYVATLSEGGNLRKEFNVTEFRKDYPELYKKYSRTIFGTTKPQLTIKEYKTPQHPCNKCNLKTKRCEDCNKLKAWKKKIKDMEELVKYSEGGTEESE